jgi:epsilon-lactone hydrolase
MSSLKSQMLRSIMKVVNWWTPDHKSLLASRERFDQFGKRYRVLEGTSVEPVDIDSLYSEWIIPPDAMPQRTILYLHGGGYEVGSCASHRALVSYIAKACQAQTLLPDYRLAPEHPFPAALDDAITVYHWLLSREHTPENLVIMGDSAGGGLALATLLSLRDHGTPLPAATVLLAPWTDLALTGESMKTCAHTELVLRVGIIEGMASKYCGNHDPRQPLISPLYADLHGLPPMLIQVGDCEILLNDSTRLAERAQATGVAATIKVWPGMWHLFHWAVLNDLSESKQAIAEIAAFVGAHLGQPVERRLETGD